MNFAQPQLMKGAVTWTAPDSFALIATEKYTYHAAMRGQKIGLFRIKGEFGHCQIKKICYNSIEIH